MGAYLSSPATDKTSTDETCDRFTYGASSMQGWRISQEDAHNCIPDFDKETSTAMFAVYDGHGGAEVAQYCSKFLPDCIKETDQYKDGELGPALVDAFLKFDSTLVQEEIIKELKLLAGVDENDEEEEDDDPVGRGEAEDLRAEADLPLDVLLAKYRTPGGSAKNLRKKENFQSPVVRAKKNSSDMEAGPSSSSDTMDAKSADSCEVKAAGSSSSCLTNGLADNENNLNKERELQDSARSCSSTDGGDSSGMVTDSGSSVGGSSPCEGGTTQTACGESGDSGKSVVHVADSSTGEAGGSGGCSSSSSSSSGVCDVGSSSSGSSGQSSKFSDASSFGDVSSSSSSVKDEGPSASGASGSKAGGSGGSKGGKNGPQSGEVDMDNDDDDEDSEEDEDEWQDIESGEEDEEEEDEGMEDADEPMMDMSNEEPGSDSGCTACVVLLRGDQLVVANAGDSRCVLCRGGVAVDLSHDHKPEDDPERQRIENAGGRVTADGRVNGGLNLSRAIGDHFYKRKEDLPPEQQMITALPDIQTVALDIQDQFFVVACDGIWNSMTSQECVDFIAERLKDPAKKSKPSLICEELFDHCLAENTYGDGTGCDNMTCVIILLRPQGQCEGEENGLAPSKRCVPDCEADAEKVDKRPRVEEEEEGGKGVGDGGEGEISSAASE